MAQDSIPAPDPLGIIEDATDGAVSDPVREELLDGDAPF